MEEEVGVKPAPKGKKAKGGKAAAAKTTGKEAAPTGDATAETPTEQPQKRRSLAVEEKYQKMTQREHIIKRPDTYSDLEWWIVIV